jgi:hypothetical protein
LTANLQTRAGNPAPGADRLHWSLFGAGPAASLAPGGQPAFRVYLLAWIADDEADGDGNPTADTNRIVQIRAEARGRLGLTHAIVASFERVDPAPAPLRRLTVRHES